MCVLRLQHGSVEQILLKVLRGNLWAGAVTACRREVLALSSCFRQRPQIWSLPECSYSHSPTHLHLELLLEVICASSIDVLKLGCSLCSKGAYSLVLSSRLELNIHFSPGQRKLCFRRDLLWARVNLILCGSTNYSSLKGEMVGCFRKSLNMQGTYCCLSLICASERGHFI